MYGSFPVHLSLSQTCYIPHAVQCDKKLLLLFLIDVANGGCLKFEDEFIQRCMTIIGGASQHLNMVYTIYSHNYYIMNNCQCDFYFVTCAKYTIGLLVSVVFFSELVLPLFQNEFW